MRWAAASRLISRSSPGSEPARPGREAGGAPATAAAGGPAHRAAAARVALAYVAVAAAWIFFSDRVIEGFAPNIARLTALQTWKGLAFVAVTGGMLFYLVRRALVAQQGAAEARRAVEERYRQLVELEADAILLVDLGTTRILEANQAAVDLYGYSREELLRMTAAEISAEPQRTRAHFASLRPGERRKLVERLHRRRDGQVFPVQIAESAFEYGGRQVLCATIRDVSAQAAAMEKIRRLKNLHAALSEMSQAIVRVRDRDELCREVCRVAVEFGGFTLAWVGWIDGGTRKLQVVASHGLEEIALRALLVSLDPGTDSGRGPTGIALATGEPYFCNDYMTDPATLAWREMAGMAGFMSSGAFPLRVGGTNVGVLNLYAGAPGFFDDETRQLLRETGVDISMALENMESERQRRRVQEVLRETGNRLDAVISASPLAIIAVDLEGRVLLWNHAAEGMFGWRAGEIMGKALPIVPDEDREGLDGSKSRIVRGEAATGLRAIRLARDGSRIEVSVSAAPLRDAAGRLSGTVGMLQDVRELARAEAELRESERRYRELFEANPHAMWVYDRETLRFLAANDSAVQQYGWSRRELLAMSVRDLWLEEESAARLADLERSMGDARREVLTRHRRRDGTVMDVEARSHPLEFSGRPARMVLAQDVTERHRAEAEVRRLNAELEERVARRTAELTEAMARLEAENRERRVAQQSAQQAAEEAAYLYDSAPCGYHSLDAEGRYLIVNDTELEWLGYRRDEILGRPFTDVLEPGSVPVFRQAFARLVAAGAVSGVECRVRRRGGAPFWVLLGAVAKRDEEGAFAMGHVTLVHYTDQKEARERIQALNADLSRQAEELRMVNQQLEAFSFSVSHDLRAPLRAVQGFAELVLRRAGDRLDGESRQHLDNVLRASRRMGQLVEDLLKYARLGEEGVEPGPVPLGEIIERVCAELAIEAGKAGARFVIREPLPTVQGDPRLLQQVFSNLLENALTYRRPETAPEIEVSAREEAGSWVIAVRDNGIGIPPDQQEAVFGMFRRLHGQDSIPGSGIGLAVVRRACRQMGGSVRLQSEPGVGSTFEVVLPGVPS